jgi:stringent starvation protein B
MLLNKKRKRPQNQKLQRYYLNQAPFESVNPDEFDPYLDSEIALHGVVVPHDEVVDVFG